MAVCSDVAKPGFAELMRMIVGHLLDELVTDALRPMHHSALRLFDDILLQDGSSFAIHAAFAGVFPGRRTTISPAAVELHELPITRIIGWLPPSRSKYAEWKKRYGKANEHNGKVPRDFWLEEHERAAIVEFHDKNPLEGYRRLTFMMLDQDPRADAASSAARAPIGLGDRCVARVWSAARSFRGVPLRTGAIVKSSLPAASSVTLSRLVAHASPNPGLCKPRSLREEGRL